MSQLCAIGNFLSTTVVFFRPKKLSYFALEWNSAQHKWQAAILPAGNYSKHTTTGYNHMQTGHTTLRFGCSLDLINNTRIKVESNNLEFLMNDAGAALPVPNLNSISPTSGCFPILKRMNGLAAHYCTIPNSWKNDFLKVSELIERPAQNCSRGLWVIPRSVAMRFEVPQNHNQIIAPVSDSSLPNNALQPQLIQEVNQAVNLQNQIINNALPNAGQARVAAAIAARNNDIELRNNINNQHNLIEPLPNRIAWLVAEAASNQQESCPISMELLSPITAGVTTCFHVFDFESIQRWMQQNSTCPTCRKRCKMTKAFNE